MKFIRTLFLAVFLLLVLAVIGLLFIVHRGFRASANPPRWEAVLARGMRNLAIPSSERKQKNPLDAESSDSRSFAVSQGHELFLTECAPCHGVDGSGATRLGQNLYPRVPDLRAGATQNLSDGEIHYIIENGVQLTGMPAWGNPHLESSGTSWKLVLFLRNLRSPYAWKSGQMAVSTTAHYVGSQACQKCHAAMYERWKKTPMANVVRDPYTHPDAIIPDLAGNTVHKFTKDQVAFVYGSLWKQRYFTKVGDDYFPLPVQWVVGKREWRPYMVPPTGGDWWAAFYPADNMQRPTGPTCDGCHSVGYDIHTKQVAEWSVGCERCHGPGSKHVERPKLGNILNPGKMDPVAANDSCIQCHSQGRPVTSPIEGKYFDWPVGYQVGLRLADFWKLEDCTLGQTNFLYFPDCTAHKNRMQGNDFVQSVMYRHGIMCSSCHDVHGTENYGQLRKPADQLCLDCHGPTSPNGPHAATLEEHTHHKAGSAGSQCVACHMPKVETEGVPGAFVSAHTFRFISPAMTDQYQIPNPCTSCHADKTTIWAKDAMSRWPEISPWRMR